MKYYNKINRNLLLNLRLHFNKASYNRDNDSSPRFYLSLIGFKGIERIAKTKKAVDHGYVKYNNYFYGSKEENFLTGDQINSILLESLKKTPPYGYDKSDLKSKEKYNKEVKLNISLQSFYKTYWNNHLDKVTPLEGGHPYIEINLHKIIKSKHLTKIPPPVTTSDSSPKTPTSYSEPKPATCSPTSFKVSYIENQYGKGSFYIDGIERDTLFLGRNKKYVFTNTNSDFYKGECVNGVLPFRLSAETDGINSVDGKSFIDGVNITHYGTTGTTETLELTVTKDTPAILNYYSPLEKEVGGVIVVSLECSVTQDLAFSQKTHSIDWEPGTSVSVVGQNLDVSTSRPVNHCTNNPERSWTGYPNRDNPNSIINQNYHWLIPTTPIVANTSTRARVPVGPIGVARNGFPFFNVFDINGGSLTEPVEFSDQCGGDVDALGRYFYVGNPECLYVDILGEHSPIVGYSFDGYPIYGPRDDGGKILGTLDLDAHHGHEHGNRGYHYHITEDSPCILGPYYRGIPNVANFLGDSSNNNSPPPGSSYYKMSSTLSKEIVGGSGAKTMYVDHPSRFNIGDNIMIDPNEVIEEVVTISVVGNPMTVTTAFKHSHAVGEIIKVQSIGNSIT